MYIKYIDNAKQNRIVETVELLWHTQKTTRYRAANGKIYEIDTSGLYPLLKTVYMRQRGVTGFRHEVGRVVGRYPEVLRVAEALNEAASSLQDCLDTIDTALEA